MLTDGIPTSTCCSVCATFHLRLQLHNAAGATQVTGLEYRHVKDLHVLMPAGVKVGLAFSQHCDCLKDSVARRRHLLFLQPRATAVYMQRLWS